jgi:hypothetical protein
MSQQKAPQVQQPSQMHHNAPNMPSYQNMQLHHPYNPQIGQNNMVYQGQYQMQQQQYQQNLHMNHARSFSSVPHNFQGQMGGYQNQGPVQMAQPGQFW